MNTYDNNIAILSYAVLSERYNSNESVILSFEPLVEDLLLTVDGDTVSKTKLVELYEQRYGYPMPPAIMNEILSSLRNSKKIEFLRNEIIEIKKQKLQDVSFEYSSTLNNLKNTFSYFAKQNGVDIKPSETVAIFLNFMSKHAVDLNSYFNNLNDTNEIDYDKETENNKIIVDFLMKVRLDNPKLFELLNDIFYGIALSSVLKLDQIKINELEQSTNITELLLDSNYIFRLLDLQTSYEYQATYHTHKLAQEAGINFYVLPETLEQISKTLNGFLEDVNPSTIAALSPYGDDLFSGIYSAYIRRSLDKSDIYELVAKLNATLDEKFNIKLWEKEIATILESDGETISSMRKFKPYTEDDGLIHDLILVRTVDMVRPTYIAEMSQAKTWVLTDDNKLMKWSSSRYNNKRIPECLTESQLSTILWLKSPKQFSGQALENVVFALRNQSLINKEQYKRISKSIEKQKERFAKDESGLNAMSLLFSTKCLSLDAIERNADSDEQLNSLFDEKVEQAKKLVGDIQKDNEKYKDENEAIKQKLMEECATHEKSRSIISEQDKSIIEMLQASINDIETILFEKKQQKHQWINRREKAERKIIGNLNIIVLSIVAIIIFTIIMINVKTSLFDNHGDLISTISAIIGIAFCVVFQKNLSDFISQKKVKTAKKRLKKKIEKGQCENFDNKINELDKEINLYEERLEESRHNLNEKLEKSN